MARDEDGTLRLALEDEQQQQYRQHRYAIEDVQRPLVGDQVGRVAHGVLNQPERAAEHDQSAQCVQYTNHLFPRLLGRVRAW